MHLNVLGKKSATVNSELQAAPDCGAVLVDAREQPFGRAGFALSSALVASQQQHPVILSETTLLPTRFDEFIVAVGTSVG